MVNVMCGVGVNYMYFSLHVILAKIEAYLRAKRHRGVEQMLGSTLHAQEILQMIVHTMFKQRKPGKKELTSGFLATRQVDLEEDMNLLIKVDHTVTYTSFTNFRLISILQNLEISNQGAYFQSPLVTFLNVRQVEEDIICEGFE